MIDWGAREGRDPSTPIVLIVEDELLVRAEIVDGLEDGGWRVFQASSGEAAVAFLRAGERIDVVITDIQLDGVLTGWDVADAFRAVHAAMPVIYTSGNPIVPARRVSGSVFFDKPCRVAKLLDACRKLGPVAAPLKGESSPPNGTNSA